MKHIFVRLAVVVLLLATVFSVAPRASAQEGTPYILYANIEWLLECGPDSVGWYIVDFGVSVAPGYTIKETGTQVSAGDFESGTWVDEWVATGYEFLKYEVSWVPYDGSWSVQYDVLASNGQLMSSTKFVADCVTGLAWTSYSDIYGINEPAANARVMGNVLVDTPVYAEANPTTALKPELKAGQTWFIVGQTTGTDGAVWYKVFVGGLNAAYVPAYTMTPQGPIPGAE